MFYTIFNMFTFERSISHVFLEAFLFSIAVLMVLLIIDNLSNLIMTKKTTEIEEEILETPDEEVEEMVIEEHKIPLESMTILQLRDTAKSMGLKGYTALNKADLLEFIKKNKV